MNRQQLIQMRDETVKKLVAGGMNQQQASFAAMTVIAKPKSGDLLSEQPKGESNDLLDSLKDAAARFWSPQEKPEFRPSPPAYGDAIADADGRDQ